MSFTLTFTGTFANPADELAFRDSVASYVQSVCPSASGSFDGPSGKVNYPAQAAPATPSALPTLDEVVAAVQAAAPAPQSTGITQST